MARALFNTKPIISLFKLLKHTTCNSHYSVLRKPACNDHAWTTTTTTTALNKYCPFLAYKQESLSTKTLLFHVEGALLRSPSIFPYFMLVSLEAGGLLRGLILLLLYPFIWLVGHEMGLKVMVFVSFFGVKARGFKIGTTVLPKFFLEDVGYEGFCMVKSCGRRVGLSDLPRVMVDGFLRHYLGIDYVVGRELKVVRGYFVGLMKPKQAINKAVSCEEKFREKKNDHSEFIGFSCLKKSLDHHHHLFSQCKTVYLVSEAEKKSWQVLPKKRYPKPLIFHDGRIAFRPTPLATLAMFMWLPFGSVVFLFRIIIGLILPYNIAIPLLYFTGTMSTLLEPKSFNSVDHSNTKDRKGPKGTLYVCNHKTLFDPIYASYAVMKPLTAVTYSLSKTAEFFAPIKTIRLTRDRKKDQKLIQDLLQQGDLVVCPEGTTCREPFLLRFSPLFAEMSCDIVPMAIDIKVSMFYATTASGFKCLDPLFMLINPYITCTFKILDKIPQALLTCNDGGKMGSWMHETSANTGFKGRSYHIECSGGGGSKKGRPLNDASINEGSGDGSGFNGKIGSPMHETSINAGFEKGLDRIESSGEKDNLALETSINTGSEKWSDHSSYNGDGAGGKPSKFDVANYVQAQIGKALDFECTGLTRKDKYMFLAGNEGKF